MNLFKVDWPSRGHAYEEEEIQAVVDVMRGERGLSQGGCVRQFERDFENYVGASRAFATMSCAHALDLTAKLLSIQKGDEVILPAHTYCATALAFARRGAQLRWADIDPHSWTISPESVAGMITSKTKALVIVHLYGLMCPHIEQFVQLAKENHIALIEDCAQSIGAQCNSRHGGTYGDFGCYSFHAQKNITTLGEGGMLLVNNEAYREKVSGLRLNGHAPFPDQADYWLPAMVDVREDLPGEWPMKTTMTEAQASLGSALLKRLDKLVMLRRRRAIIAREVLSGIDGIQFQEIPQHASMHSHHLLPFSFIHEKRNRNDVIRILSSDYKIKAITQYYPLNRYSLFSDKGYGASDLPNTDRLFDSLVSLPFSPIISDEDFEYVIASVRDALASAIETK